MSAGESEAGLGVVENRAEPVGGGVAQRTILGKTSGNVIGVGGLVERGEMTPLALGRSIGELTVQMALRAGRGGVCASQRESDAGVIKRGIEPGRRVVAHRAGSGEARCYVVGVLGGSVILPVAAITIGRCALKLIIDMASDAR